MINQANLDQRKQGSDTFDVASKGASHVFLNNFIRLLLILVPIVNVFWYPISVIEIDLSFNVVPMDLLLVVCWIVAILIVIFRFSQMERSEKIAWWIVILVNLPLILSPMAALIVADGENLTLGIMNHLKRIGLASILLPLAVHSQLNRSSKLLLGSIAISALILQIGRPSLLGLNDAYFAEYMLTTGRSVSLLYNPNTLGIVTGTYMLFIALQFKPTRLGYSELVSFIGFVSALIGFLSAASRTALIALALPVTYLFTRRRSSASWILIVLLVGISAGAVMVDEGSSEDLLISRTLGIESVDQNFSARLDIQTRALANIWKWPLGAGIGNIGLVLFDANVDVSTTDSLYVDYLSAIGFLGLFSIIAALVTLWRNLSGSRPEGLVARAILLYVAAVSFSTLGIASNFISPLFFLFMGYGLAANYPEEQLVEPMNAAVELTSNSSRVVSFISRH